MSCKHKWTEPPECPQCCAEERDRLQAELAQVKAELEDTAEKMCILAAELDATRSELAQTKAAVQQLATKVEDLEIDRIGYQYAIALLRNGMGLDDKVEDLRECLLKYNEFKAALAPTIELLKWSRELLESTFPHTKVETIDRAIARLESITKGHNETQSKTQSPR